ncbi:hypothetical protein QFZ53_003230 [Microbacterium natoriense]|uniref:Lipoprotein n=1 Tax=Microbacterium natoriense TaxID=284570 RepID=A0AAW8F2A2_9MICO|nr:hypothetical protein [Microbacterium natoriense]MDQ0649034.1 hypothetical protein [Microbacterium natoriense]
MTSHRTASHALAGIGAALLMVAVLSGCTPEPEPTPTPTAAFASEEEAFAAAEKVYREYTDAVNSEREGDHTVDPLSYLIGEALDGSLDTSNKLQAQELRIVGDSRVLKFSGNAVDLQPSEVIVGALVCLDVSATVVLNVSDADVTPPDRPAHVPLNVEFISSGSKLVISGSDLAEGTEC